MDKVEYTSLLISRANEFIAYWNSHCAGSREVRESFDLGFLASNVVEQVERIKRISSPGDPTIHDLLSSFDSLLSASRPMLLSQAIVGSSPDAMLPIIESSVNSLVMSLESDEDYKLEPDVYDRLTDCLVKRDDFDLIHRFVLSELHSVEEEGRSPILEQLAKWEVKLAEFDEALKKRVDVFAVVHGFCRDYIAANGLDDNDTYWWLHAPIDRASDTSIHALLGTRNLLDEIQQDPEYAPLLNLRIALKKSRLTDAPSDEMAAKDEFARSIAESDDERSFYYKLAAKSTGEQKLEAGIYALVVNNHTSEAEHHRIVGAVGSSHASPRAFNQETKQMLEWVPTVAQAQHRLPPKEFTLGPTTTSEGIEGKSIGLAAYFEYLRLVHFIKIEKPVAATGTLELDGSVRAVADINKKLDRALAAGFQTIIAPSENRADVHELIIGHSGVLFVSNVKEAVNALNRTEGQEVSDDDAVDLELRSLKVKLESEGFTCSEVGKAPWQYFIGVTRGGEKAKVVTFFDKSQIAKPPIVRGPVNSSLVARLNELLESHLGIVPESKGGHFIRYKLVIQSVDTRLRIKDYLTTLYRDKCTLATEANCDFRINIGGASKIIVKQYQTGTLNVEGKSGASLSKVLKDIETVAEQPFVEGEPDLKSEDPLQVLPQGITSWIGVDEAGKGDYFGPLVTAAVLVDQRTKGILLDFEVKDSKRLSDKKNIEIAERIRAELSDKCYVLVTMPEKYNELMSGPSFENNSQRLLGWQHRRAIENILQRYECKYAVCDKFGSDYFIEEGLKTGKGVDISIIQRTKAESDVAVAAASILARSEYLLRLQRMAAEFETAFPRGSSDFDSILKVAKTLMARDGRDVLKKVAKVHFATTAKILEEFE